jgi:hypothetical protein
MDRDETFGMEGVISLLRAVMLRMNRCETD